MKNEELSHAVLNQLETDLDEQEYDALDELLTKLIEIPQARELLVIYLEDNDEGDKLEFN